MKYEENVHVYLVKADTFAKGQKIKLIWIRFIHGYILTPSMQLQAMPTSAAERFVPERTNKQTCIDTAAGQDLEVAETYLVI